MVCICVVRCMYLSVCVYAHVYLCVCTCVFGCLYIYICFYIQQSNYLTTCSLSSANVVKISEHWSAFQHLKHKTLSPYLCHNRITVMVKMTYVLYNNSGKFWTILHRKPSPWIKFMFEQRCLTWLPYQPLIYWHQ